MLLEQLYLACLILSFVLPFLLVPLFFILPAPYGKFTSDQWGPVISGRLGWAFHQSAALLSFLATLYASKNDATYAQKLLGSMWIVHYLHRSIIYPCRATSMKPTPIYTVAAATLLNVLNGFVQGFFIATFKGDFHITQQTYLGIGLFAIGFLGNIYHDNILFNLRSQQRPADQKVPVSRKMVHEQSYFLPHGGLFDYATCPNYSFELLEWFGYIVAAKFQLVPCLFWVLTASHFVPRSFWTRQWYLERFGSGKFPKERAALIPFLY